MEKDTNFMIKMMAYVIFFIIAISCKRLVQFFLNMDNMAYAMILMSVVMLVDKWWELLHAKD